MRTKVKSYQKDSLALSPEVIDGFFLAPLSLLWRVSESKWKQFHF